MKTRSLVRCLPAVVLAASCALAHASGGGGGGGGSGGPATAGMAGQSIDPQYAAGVQAIDAGRFADAIPLLQAYLAHADGKDADAENWLGYAYRRSGDYDDAFLHYDKALAINPRHRGAHEYMGEAYLLLGNLPQAEEHLKVLDDLCLFPCAEYRELKTKVAEYKSAHAQTVGAN